MATSRATPKTTSPKATNVVFTLAQANAEIDDKDRPEPFVVDLAGPDDTEPKLVTFKDPESLEWLAQASLDPRNVIDLFRKILEPDDFRTLVDTKMRGTALRLIVEAWAEHYGWTNLGEYGG